MTIDKARGFEAIRRMLDSGWIDDPGEKNKLIRSVERTESAGDLIINRLGSIWGARYVGEETEERRILNHGGRHWAYNPTRMSIPEFLWLSATNRYEPWHGGPSNVIRASIEQILGQEAAEGGGEFPWHPSVIKAGIDPDKRVLERFHTSTEYAKYAKIGRMIQMRVMTAHVRDEQGRIVQRTVTKAVLRALKTQLE